MTKSLASQHCRPLPEGTPALDEVHVAGLLDQLAEGWSLAADHKRLSKVFRFPDFHRTMAFVNALAWIAHVEDHHPDVEFGYNYCRVHWSTHTVNGLSMNDFICAARIDGLGA